MRCLLHNDYERKQKCRTASFLDIFGECSVDLNAHRSIYHVSCLGGEEDNKNPRTRQNLRDLMPNNMTTEGFISHSFPQKICLLLLVPLLHELKENW